MSGQQDSPTVSIIIPTHNRSMLLREAIESVLAQTFAPIEVIVVDDGSVDDTEPVVAAYGESVRYIRQENTGVAAARNHGFADSHGEYVGFLDDDDIFLPAKIEQQVRQLESKPEIALTHCRFYHINERGKRISRIGLLPQGNVLAQLLCKNFIWMGAPLIRRRVLEQVGAFDAQLSTGADYDIWLRIAAAGYEFGCVQQPLGAYRIQRNSMVTNIAKTEHEVIFSLDRMFANPELAIALTSIQNQAYATWRFWFSRRYYAVGEWEKAQQNLVQAYTLYPQLLHDRAELILGFCSEALDERIHDPVAYLENVFQYLPPELDFARCYQPEMLQFIALGAALRHYGLEELAYAQDRLTEAIRSYPGIVEKAEDFAQVVFDNALCLPVEANQYVNTVFNNLPSEAEPLTRLRARVFSDVNIARAFEDYYNNSHGTAVRRILRALRTRPTWIRNRGVLSVLVKSLLHG